MKKTLIRIDNLEGYICPAYGRLYAGGAILTPGARDALAKRNIRVVHGERPAADPCHEGAGHNCSACAGNQSASNHGGTPDEQCIRDALIGVAAMIRREYGVTDPDQLRDMTLNVVRTLHKHIR